MQRYRVTIVWWEGSADSTVGLEVQDEFEPVMQWVDAGTESTRASLETHARHLKRELIPTLF